MYKNQYAIGRHVRLVPPPAKIVGVEFRQVQTPGGIEVKPFYTILAQGQVVGGVPESDILRIDDVAEQRERNIHARDGICEDAFVALHAAHDAPRWPAFVANVRSRAPQGVG